MSGPGGMPDLSKLMGGANGQGPDIGALMNQMQGMFGGAKGGPQGGMPDIGAMMNSLGGMAQPKPAPAQVMPVPRAVVSPE